jgi:endoglucanase
MQKIRKMIVLLLTASLLLASFAWAEPAGEMGITIPEITLTQQPIPDNEAMQFLKKMGVGWNLGNTFDAIKGDWNRNADEMTVEKSWVGVYTTKELIQAVHDAGFTTLRLPVSWHDHVFGSDYKISEKWLNRVQEVADWAIEQGMYVILNLHHDEDQFLPSQDHLQESLKYVGSLWSQLAERFRDYDEHLIFESLNEPRLVGTSYEWTFDSFAPQCKDAAECLNQLNQLFVDTVRASGGNNATRYLMVPGYAANPYYALVDDFKLPADSADNRIIVSVHAYTPYPFALQIGGQSTFDLTTSAQKNEIMQFIQRLYTRYIVNGIPVVIGEFGALDKKNLQDRVDFTAFYVAAASSRNLPAVWWDNGAFSGNGEIFGLIDRTNYTWKFPEIVEAMMQYGGYDKLPAKE